MKYSLEEARTVTVNEDTVAFYSKHSYLSNFHQAFFMVDSVQYNSVEQIYVRRKLEAAGRTDLIPTIMQTEECLQMKRMGDLVTVPQDSEWHQRKDQIVRQAVLAKFEQNEQLMIKLKSTQVKVEHLLKLPGGTVTGEQELALHLIN